MKDFIIKNDMVIIGTLCTLITTLDAITIYLHGGWFSVFMFGTFVALALGMGRLIRVKARYDECVEQGELLIKQRDLYESILARVKKEAKESRNS